LRNCTANYSPVFSSESAPHKKKKLKTVYNSIVGAQPDAPASIKQHLKVLCSIEDLASCTPASVGEREEWAAIVSSAEHSRESYCKALRGKAQFSTQYGNYSVTLHELKKV
jgi:hypothetical protein